MKNKQSLIVFIFLCTSYFGFGQSDIIISQYIETNSGTAPKGIEIFNISGSDIDFSIANLQVYQGTNGGTCTLIAEATINSGILKTNEVWVIGTNTAPDLIAYSIANGTALSGTTSYSFTFNGDDALQIYLGGVLQDQFGVCGSDPGTSWSGGGVSTANQNIQVKNGLCDGDIDGWTDPSLRFTTISIDPVNDMTGFGNAPASCSCTPPADPSGTISGTTPACTNTLLSYSAPNANLYWQTTAAGTSTTNPTTSPYNATTTGTYYVRAYNGSCWSTNSVSYGVTINTPITVSGQPVDVYVLVSEAATFIVGATGTPALSYQWQVSTDGGAIWNSVVGGTGATTAAYTTDAAVLSMDGDLYRCVVTNTCGSVNTNTALLNVSTLADVVITEIMYNTSGFDDEWIEICNLSGSSQKIGNHKIAIGGTIVFSFPGGTSIVDGTCITVSLGSNGDTVYNNGDGTLLGGFCPFTPDFGIAANTNNTNNLNNTTQKITLLAPNASTEADAVTYHSSDGANGNGSSLHVIDSSQDNSDTGTNWQELDYGGSSGLNNLLPNCLPAGVDINVEGNLNNFPDITDGDTSPIFLIILHFHLSL